jgi:hypothetical protein
MAKRKITKGQNLIRYLRLYYYHWVDVLTEGLLISGEIIRPVASVSVLILRIIYISIFEIYSS